MPRVVDRSTGTGAEGQAGWRVRFGCALNDNLSRPHQKMWISALSTGSRESSMSETVIELPSVSVLAWSTLSGELIRCVPEANPHQLPRICEAALLKGKAVSFKRFGFVGRCDFEIECS